MADHERGRVRGEPDDTRRDLLGRAHPPDRFFRDHLGAALGSAPVKRPIIGVSMYPGQIALIRMLRRVVESRR